MPQKCGIFLKKDVNYSTHVLMNVKLNSSTMKKVIFNLLIFAPVSMFALGNFEISGKVIDIMTNQPLFECHVYLNDNYGVLTDEDGFFKLEVPVGYENGKLQISLQHLG